MPVSAREHDRIDLVLAARAPVRSHGDDARAQRRADGESTQMLAEGFLPGRAEMIVQAVDQHRQQRLAQTTFDLRAVAGKYAEIEGQEIIGNPVDASPAASGFGDRRQPFGQP